MSEMLQGKIATLRIAKATDKWATYEVAFTDGTTAKVGHALDREPLRVGDSIECVENNFGGWRSTKIYSDGGERADRPQQQERPHREEGAKTNYTYSPPKSTANDRENYWQSKANYEETVRDPKIERQTYIRMAVDAYNAGLAFQTEIPNTPEEINTYFQMAVDLGESVYQTMSKK